MELAGSGAAGSGNSGWATSLVWYDMMMSVDAAVYPVVPVITTVMPAPAPVMAPVVPGAVHSLVVGPPTWHRKNSWSSFSNSVVSLFHGDVVSYFMALRDTGMWARRVRS